VFIFKSTFWLLNWFIMVDFSKKEEKIFHDFVTNFNLSLQQADAFKKYLSMLLRENEKINLTTITSVEGVIRYHFADSLLLSKCIDFTAMKSIGDIGTGGGFPGIPLKILYPHLRLTLIEVVQKKVRFLRKMIKSLNLDNSQVYDLDWRTFLRKTDYDIDLFCARASLQPDELIRMFKSSCRYKNAQLVYFAATGWSPSDKVEKYVKKEEKYKVGNKKRKFIFLGL